jgi:hypothetical protein
MSAAPLNLDTPFIFIGERVNTPRAVMIVVKEGYV